MLTNYLKIAFRNLLKQKTFSFINIFGLALSMSVCLLVIMLIKDAHSYDRFHPESDRVYRVVTTPVRKDGRTEHYASSPYLVGKTLAEEYPQTELWTPFLRSLSGNIQADGQKIGFNGLLTNESFFEMFGFELAAGDRATALKEPYSIVLTQELAQKLFKNENPLGKTLEVPGYGSGFKVTGVLKEFPGKTHLEFEALGSDATQLAEEKRPDMYNVTGEWRDYYMNYNFIRLKKGTDPKAAELALADIAKTRYNDLELESRDMGYRFSLQSIEEITPGTMMSNSMGGGMPAFLVWFLTALGLAIILSACFNYTNLTIARSLVRTKEVGVRKVLGASRSQVFWQFIGEAVVTAILALVIGYHLLKLMIPFFSQLQFSQFVDLEAVEDWKLYAWFFVFTVSVGFIAGLMPAATLSRTTPVAILQKLQNIKLIQRIGLRKALLVVQFTITLIFFITVTIAWRQADHAISVNFGFDQPKTLLVNMQGEPYSKVLPALSQVSGVEHVSAISIPMGTWSDGSTDVRTEESAEKTGVREYFIDHNYLEDFNIELVAGENFPENLAQQKELFAIVNETFVQNFDLGEPGDAVGHSLLLGDSTLVTIRGVVRDFPFKPATYGMESLLLRYDPARLGILNLKLSDNNIPGTLTSLERNWKQLGADLPFEAKFFDQTVRENYTDILEIIRVVGFFGVLGMVIACMGLLGMAIYTVESKAKEISIRKVMGAGARDVVLMLSRGYLILFGIAVLIAAPVSFLIGSQMLQTFADRISWSPVLFLPGILLLFLVAGLTIGSQTLRAVLLNPVKSLRSE